MRESMSDARAAEEALEKRLEREQEQPTLGETPGARYARERREREAAEAEAQRQAERLREVEETVARSRKPAPNLRWESLPGSWTAGEARRMLQQGYLLEHVMKVTGVGYRWLDDIPVDKTGRGCPKVA